MRILLAQVWLHDADEDDLFWGLIVDLLCQGRLYLSVSAKKDLHSLSLPIDYGKDITRSFQSSHFVTIQAYECYDFRKSEKDPPSRDGE
jgi:hypothetical protein